MLRSSFTPAARGVLVSSGPISAGPSPLGVPGPGVGRASTQGGRAAQTQTEREEESWEGLEGTGSQTTKTKEFTAEERPISCEKGGGS